MVVPSPSLASFNLLYGDRCGKNSPGKEEDSFSAFLNNNNSFG